MVILTRSPVSCAALSGRYEADLHIWRSWLRGCPGPNRGGVGSTLQLLELVEEAIPWLYPAKYVTTASHSTFELMVRAHGRSPTALFLLYLLFSDALGMPSPRTSISPA